MNNVVSIIVREALCAEPTHVQTLGGGSINHAARIETDGSRYFVKWNTYAPPAFFELEARGLALLRAAGALRVPEVIAHSEANDQRPAYLVLEWIEGSRQAESRAFAIHFGQALAQQHHVLGASFGLDHDNYIGELPQSNMQTAGWIDFYRDQRIMPQMMLARKQGLLPAERERRLNKVMERLDDWLGSVKSVPSLLHGDLWSGNFLIGANNQPVVVDPAVYYGDREIEIAFTELFGGFPAGFLSAYNDAYPLEPGYPDRRALYQLYPLLAHLNIFGESYGGQVDTVCRRYVT